MKKRLTELILILMAGIAPALFGQSLTLNEAVSKALNKNPEIKEYSHKLKQKEKENLAAWGNFLPSVEVTGRYTHLNDKLDISLNPIRDAMIELQTGNQVEMSNIYSIIQNGVPLNDQQRAGLYTQYKSGLSAAIPEFVEILKEQDYRTATITGKQPIFLGGKLIAAKKYSSAEEKAAEAEFEKTKEKITSETIKRYLAALMLQKVTDLREEVYSATQDHVRDAERLFNEGVIANYQLLRAKVAAAEASRSLKDDRNKLELARLALANIIGDDGAPEYVLPESFSYAEYEGEAHDLVRSAMENQPVLRMIEYKKKAAGQKYNVEMAGLLPSIAAFGKYEMIPEELSALEPRWAVGVQAQWNLFNGFKDVLGMQAAKHLEKEVEQMEEKVRRDISLLVNKNYLTAQNASTKYLEMESDINLAAENFRMNKKRFEAGTGTSLEVTDARLSYEKVKVERLQALYDYYSALADLYNSVGSTDKFFEIWNKRGVKQ